MAAISGKNGRVYAVPLLVEDCEDTWAEQVVSGVALSTTTGAISGSTAARATTTTVGATTVLMSEVISKDLTTYEAAVGWFRSSLTTSADDLRLQLDDTADVASPLEDLSMPVLTANTWRLCSFRFSTPASLGSLISIGLYQNVDLADGTFDVDNVYAVKEIDGMTVWNIDSVDNTVDSSDLQSAGVMEFTPTTSQWSGSFSGHKDGTPLTRGTHVYGVFGESLTNTQNWVGEIIITGITANADKDGLVTYSYTFQGTGALEDPTT